MYNAGRGTAPIHITFLQDTDAQIATACSDQISPEYLPMCRVLSAKCVSSAALLGACLNLRILEILPAVRLDPYLAGHRRGLPSVQSLKYFGSVDSNMQHLEKLLGEMPALRDMTFICMKIDASPDIALAFPRLSHLALQSYALYAISQIGILPLRCSYDSLRTLDLTLTTFDDPAAYDALIDTLSNSRFRRLRHLRLDNRNRLAPAPVIARLLEACPTVRKLEVYLYELQSRHFVHTVMRACPPDLRALEFVSNTARFRAAQDVRTLAEHFDSEFPRLRVLQRLKVTTLPSIPRDDVLPLRTACRRRRILVIHDTRLQDAP